jgi:hypothetical protein
VEQQNNYIEIAKVIIDAARNQGYLDGPLNVIEDISDTEKELFVKMLAATQEYLQREKKNELSADEIVSLFTYVFAKAGEAVTSWCNGQPFEFSAHGMFDGKIPMYSDSRLMQHFKQITLPSDLAGAFGDWAADNPDFCTDHEVAPVILLFEALKWTWRISVNVTIDYLESLGFKFQD